jgi:hypothetical protein
VNGRYVGKSLQSSASERATSRRRPARLGLAGAMITEYPLEHRWYDQSEYEPFWAAAAALDLPLSLHTATRRQGKDPRGRRQDLARRQQPRDKGVLSGIVAVRSDLLRRLRASSPPDTGRRRVRVGLGAPPALDDGLHLPRAPRRGDLPVQEPALAKTGDGVLPSDFFPRSVVLSFQEDAIDIRLRDLYSAGFSSPGRTQRQQPQATRGGLRESS